MSKPLKGWFQIHLATVLVLTLSAGIIVKLNLTPTGSPSCFTDHTSDAIVIHPLKPQDAESDRTYWCYQDIGWPWKLGAIKETIVARVVERRDYEISHELTGLIKDVLAAIVILAVVAAASEACIRGSRKAGVSRGPKESGCDVR